MQGMDQKGKGICGMFVANRARFTLFSTVPQLLIKLWYQKFAVLFIPVKGSSTHGLKMCGEY